jgi:hypothetical protein
MRRVLSECPTNISPLIYSFNGVWFHMMDNSFITKSFGCNFPGPSMLWQTLKTKPDMVWDIDPVTEPVYIPSMELVYISNSFCFIRKMQVRARNRETMLNS